MKAALCLEERQRVMRPLAISSVLNEKSLKERQTVRGKESAEIKSFDHFIFHVLGTKPQDELGTL